MHYLVTGGCGFIGSHLVRHLLAQGKSVTNLDKLTYAGNPANLKDVESDPKYRFVHGDIADSETVGEILAGVDGVINVAAETHVDRSIDDPEAFLKTNIDGVYRLCEEIRRVRPGIRLTQVSTDEVYGSLDEGFFDEQDSFSPSSPYAASKLAGEQMALSYHRTYGMDVVSTRGSNTYGPHQFPEKLIPYFATELFDGRNVPLYGDGRNVRDWLHVDDHARAIAYVAENGDPGEAYNVPGGNEKENIEIVRTILVAFGADESRVEWVKDRPGHDRRYAIRGEKLQRLGFTPDVPIEEGLRETVRWYRENEAWWRPLKEASKEFFARHYKTLKKN